MVKFQTQHVKSSKASGKNAEIKKTGYATGPVPRSMLPVKGGKNDFEGYTGPDVAKVEK